MIWKWSENYRSDQVRSDQITFTKRDLIWSKITFRPNDLDLIWDHNISDLSILWVHENTLSISALEKGKHNILITPLVSSRCKYSSPYFVLCIRSQNVSVVSPSSIRGIILRTRSSKILWVVGSESKVISFVDIF